ncbi:MAG: cbb3-type cytochrome oxidase assembly protein CcoS [Pseudomonadota bacterium]
MNTLVFLIPVSIALALCALVGFFWAVRSGQYEDLEGDAERFLYSEDRPSPKRKP